MIEKLKLPFMLLTIGLIAGFSYLLLNNSDYNDLNADGLSRGKAALQQGDYSEAAEWFMQAAKLGNREAQYRYAMLYRDGQGVDRDDTQAVRWLKLAAAQKHADSQYELAKLFDSGRGMEQADPAAAVSLFRKAAQQKHSGAQLRLAVHYAEGRGVAQDDGQALHWAVESTRLNNSEAKPYLQQLLKRVTAKAMKGDAKAQFVLAMLYRKGEGLNADLKSAEQWLRQSAESGNSDAQFHLASFLADEQQPDKLKEAARWYLAAAKQEHIKAMAAYGRMAATGTGMEANPQQALKWLHKAAESGDAQAQSALGIIYGETPGFSHDDKQAVAWLSKAAASGRADAKNNLAVMYALGRGTDKNMKQAYKLWQQAADRDAKAEYNLGVMFLRGFLVVQNDETAASWFSRSEANGNSQARLALALLYHLGRGVIYSETDAIKWYQEAADHGDVDAIFNLATLYYKIGDFAKAFECFLQAATAGDAQACNIVASMYQRGQGVQYNIDRAVKWYTKAANAGNLQAQFNLGNLYRKGDGVEQLDKRAAQWYEKAAKAGYAQAQNSLAYMYALGRGIKMDQKQARKWLEAAAAQGLNIAQQNLSLLEQKQSSFTLISHAAEMDVRAGLLYEKPLNLSKYLDRHTSP